MHRRMIVALLAFSTLLTFAARVAAQSTTYYGCLECTEERPRHCEGLFGPCSMVCEQVAHQATGSSTCVQGPIYTGGIQICGTIGPNCSGVEFPEEEIPPEPETQG